MFDFEKRLVEISAQTILCIGDLMLDDFVYGDVSRISPEAPAPVIRVTPRGRHRRRRGKRGAQHRQPRCEMPVRRRDRRRCDRHDTAARARQAQSRDQVASCRRSLAADDARKLRFVSEHFSTHLLRADWEIARPVDARTETALTKQALKLLPRADAVVLSDYGKGVLTPKLIRAVIERAKKLGKPVVVDPKGIDFSIYRGATSRHAESQGTGRGDASAGRHRQRDRSGGQSAGRDDRQQGGAGDAERRGHVALYAPDGGGPCAGLPGEGARRLRRGGYGRGRARGHGRGGADFESAMRAANAAASVVVGKSGTATVSAAELRARILPAATLAAEEKIVFDWRELDARLKEWRAQDLRIGFTNGVFDLLHPGHIKVLAQSRAACDRLVVGLNSDASVKRLKGKDRPIQPEHARARCWPGSKRSIWWCCSSRTRRSN